MLRTLSYTLAVVGLILGHMWLAVPLFGVARWGSGVAILAILGLCVLGNRRSGGHWGFAREALGRGFAWALAFTVPAVLTLLLLGWEMGTLRSRDGLLPRFVLLLVWAFLQQFVLQTVILREARAAFERRAALGVAAGIFAMIHLPNPFLTVATLIAGFVWCWIYDRHPNLVPIAVSHAATSLTAAVALGPGITGGMRVGYGYLINNGIWF